MRLELRAINSQVEDFENSVVMWQKSKSWISFFEEVEVRYLYVCCKT
jgi:hypothetical protein